MSTAPIAETQATPAPAAPRRKRHWLRLVLGLMGAIVAVVVGLYVYSEFATRTALAEAQAEAASDIAHWRLMDLEANRRHVPDAQNSALRVIMLTRKGGGIAFTSVPRYYDIFGKLPANADLNEQQIEIIRNVKAKIPELLDEARKLKDMPYGRYPILYSDDIIGTLMPDQQKARQLADWLEHDACLRAHDGDLDEALDSCRALLNVSRSLGDEPTLISFLIRVSIRHTCILSLERVVAQGEASEASLRQMQSLLELDMSERVWLQAVRGERAGFNHLFENIRSGKVRPALMSTITRPRPLSVNEWIIDRFPMTLLKHFPEYLQYMNRAVDAAKLPCHERAEQLDQLGKDAKNSSNPVIRMLAPGLDKTHTSDCRSQIALATAVSALACERYRLKHGEWPASLDVLVKDGFLAGIPADPMDGQPLRYRRTKEGVVVYSVGLDKKDDGGNIDPERIYQPGVDIGFRVWDVPLRRRPAPPPVAIDDQPK